MATFTESFNKADGAGFGPDLTWTQVTAGAGTVSGEARATSAGVNTLNTPSISLAGPDHYAEIEITTLGTLHYCDVQVILRYTDINNYYAVMRVFSNAVGGRGYIFRKVVGGTLTDVEGVALAFTAPEIFRGEIEGSDIRLLINGSPVDSWIDTDLTTGSNVALGIFRSSTASTRLITVNSMEIGDLGGGVTLVVADAMHAQTADNVTLTQAHILAVGDATHAHTADAVELTQAHSLTVADTTHAHAADTVTLAAAGDLVPADTTHAHTADSPTLVQAHTLTVADASHAHIAESPTVSSAVFLVIADTSHTHAADPVTLTQVHMLTVADAGHAHSAGAVVLTQAHQLAAADSVHAHVADVVTLIDGEPVPLPEARYLSVVPATRRAEVIPSVRRLIALED